MWYGIFLTLQVNFIFTGYQSFQIGVKIFFKFLLCIPISNKQELKNKNANTQQYVI